MRSISMKLGALTFVLLLLAAACGPADEAGEAPETTEAEEATTTEAPTTTEAALPGEGVTVAMARANWDTGYFQAEVYRTLLGELGYDVTSPEENELGADLFYLALAQGEVDFWVNGWFPLHDPFLEGEVPGSGEPVGDLVSQVGFEVRAGALQGYLIDKATQEEHGITRMSDIATDPETAALFDGDGNGLADLIGCNPGWGCEGVIENHFEAFGWGENIEHLQGEYSSLMADTIARVQRGEPALYYTWTPNWTVGALTPGEDVMWIQSEALPEDGDTSVEGLEGCVADPCEMGWPPNDIRVVANNEFLDANPAARALFEQVQIPLVDISSQNLLMQEGENTQADIEQHAADWIAENRDAVEIWLQNATDAAG